MSGDDTIAVPVSVATVSTGAGPSAGHRAPTTAAEVAAVVAAMAVFTSGGGDDMARVTPRWRFSGRWWTKPVPTRRDRP